jgi:hypothetical protein
MASFASRLAGIRKFDGLLVPAAELCGMVRAFYLSPSLPFLLCFKLWKYLSQQLPKGNPSYSVGHSRRPEESWACGPPKVMKNRSCSATNVPGSTALPFVISTGAKRSGEICGSAVRSWKCFPAKSSPNPTANQARIRFIYLASTASSSIIGP